MSRLNKLENLKKINTLSELEQDILEFYKWLLLDKKTNNDLAYKSYISIVLCAMKIINKHDLDLLTIQRQAMKLGLISQYFYLDALFEIETFRDKYFTLDEIKFKRNRWYMPEIDKLH